MAGTRCPATTGPGCATWRSGWTSAGTCCASAGRRRSSARIRTRRRHGRSPRWSRTSSSGDRSGRARGCAADPAGHAQPMATYERTIEIDAPADAVFGFVSDVDNLPRYFDRMTSAEPAGGGEAVHVTDDLPGRHVEGEAWFTPTPTASGWSGARRAPTTTPG